MKDDMKLDLYDFAKRIGINYDEEKMHDDAFEFCSQIKGLSSHGDLLACETDFKNAVEKAIIDSAKPSFKAFKLDVKLERDGNVSIVPNRFSDWKDVVKEMGRTYDDEYGLEYLSEDDKLDVYGAFKEETYPLTDDKEIVEEHLDMIKKHEYYFIKREFNDRMNRPLL